MALVSHCRDTKFICNGCYQETRFTNIVSDFQHTNFFLSITRSGKIKGFYCQDCGPKENVVKPSNLGDE